MRRPPVPSRSRARREHLAHVLHRRRHCRQLLERGARRRGDDPRERRLPAAGRPEEDRRADPVLRDRRTERRPLAEDVHLPDELVERPRPQPLRERRQLARPPLRRFREEVAHAGSMLRSVLETSLRGEVAELLSRLIQVDTTNPPGNETAAAELLREYLEANGVACELYARVPERASLVARIRGTGDGPTLLFLSHTDVVLADPAEWSVPPFSGEIRDGEIWGRGALDMKSQVAASAVAIASLAREGFAPAGDLIFAATADEEVGDGFGLSWLCEEHPDARALRLRGQRGRRRPARARRRRLLHLLDGREDDGAVPHPRARPLRARVDAGDRRQRAREGGDADRAARRVPAGAADAAGGRGVPARRCSATCRRRLRVVERARGVRPRRSSSWSSRCSRRRSRRR